MTEPSADAQDAFFLAAKSGDEETIAELTQNEKYKLKVNAKDALGNTALHYASGSCHVGVVKLILANKAVNVNVQNNLGEIPLHKAVAKNLANTPKTIILLIDAGSKVNLKNTRGETVFDVCKNADNKELLTPQQVDGFDPDFDGRDDEEKNEEDSD